MNDLPLISIITATYNAGALIEKTINSILNQKYPSVEYIIVDGGSSDDTLAVVEKYKNVVNFCISEPDEGIYDAWNKGVKIANGEWISFLGAGDEYLPDALTNYVDYINSSANKLDLVSSKVDVVNSSGKSLYLLGSKFQWPKFLDYMNIAHVGSLHNKSLFENYGYYNTQYKIVGDYELLLRAGPDLKAGFIENITARMLFGGISISKKSLKEAFQAKMLSGYLSPYTAFLYYYLSLFKGGIRYFLFKKGIFISVRK